MPVPEIVLQTLLLPGAMTRNLRASFKDDKAYEFPEWDNLLKEFHMDKFQGKGAEIAYRLEVSFESLQAALSHRRRFGR